MLFHSCTFGNAIVRLRLLLDKQNNTGYGQVLPKHKRTLRRMAPLLPTLTYDLRIMHKQRCTCDAQVTHHSWTNLYRSLRMIRPMMRIAWINSCKYRMCGFLTNDPLAKQPFHRDIFRIFLTYRSNRRRWSNEKCTSQLSGIQMEILAVRLNTPLNAFVNS